MEAVLDGLRSVRVKDGRVRSLFVVRVVVVVEAIVVRDSAGGRALNFRRPGVS